MILAWTCIMIESRMIFVNFRNYLKSRGTASQSIVLTSPGFAVPLQLYFYMQKMRETNVKTIVQSIGGSQ